MSWLKRKLDGERAVLAPLVMDALMAKMAEKAGFEALYLGGGASGYRAVHLEANLSLTEMVQAGIAIRAHVDLPLILDGAGGWGDPMHVVHSVRAAEAAGFAAIEIEDQHLPKRAHHHVGLEHMVEPDLMAAKVREAVAARRSDGFVVIARTNGVRASSMDDALRRAEAYREAGADALLLSPRTPDEVRTVGERLGAPLVMLCRPGGLANLDMTREDLEGLGFRLLVDPTTPLLAAYEAMRAVYHDLAGGGFAHPTKSAEEWSRLQDELHETIDLEERLAIERQTVERSR